jgi:hypothetical protein
MLNFNDLAMRQNVPFQLLHFKQFTQWCMATYELISYIYLELNHLHRFVTIKVHLNRQRRCIIGQIRNSDGRTPLLEGKRLGFANVCDKGIKGKRPCPQPHIFGCWTCNCATACSQSGLAFGRAAGPNKAVKSGHMCGNQAEA